MDTSMPDLPPAGGTAATEQNKEESTSDSPGAPPSSSVLSDVPPTDSEHKGPEVQRDASVERESPANESPATDGRSTAQPEPAQSHATGGPAPSATGEQATHSMEDVRVPGPPSATAALSAREQSDTPKARPRGRPPKKASLANGTVDGDSSMPGVEGGQSTPGPTVRGRARGRAGGRPRGKGRAGRGGAAKRKRGDDDDDQGDSDSSDEVTPVATMTKSGRSVSKPTSYVPPPQPSPTTAPNKRKRQYTHRNPQTAVCKSCLRGTSPASNPVVFCDGCNAPYHRWCHKPPIEQTVIDEADKEWYCRFCEEERVVPVPESEVASFVSAAGASEEQRQKYFASLPPGVLVTLLVKATTLQPELPLFDPESKAATSTAEHKSATNGPAPVPDPSSSKSTTNAAPATAKLYQPPPSRKVPAPDDATYGPDVHPENYPRPGQGLMSTLPPEQDDLDYLVDDNDEHGVFTHVYQAGSTRTDASGGAAR